MGEVSPNKAGSELRPLTIIPARDKVMLGTMRVILEAIYEPIFCNWSHGFRTGVSHGTQRYSHHYSIMLGGYYTMWAGR